LVEGVEGKQQAQGIQFMSQHEIFWIRRLFHGGEGRGCGKQAGGILFLIFPTVESKGLPHQRGSTEATGDAVKAANLDQDPDVLEVEMAANSVQKILKANEGAIFGALTNNELPTLPGEGFYLHETDPNLSVVAGIFDLTLVDIGRKDFKPHPPRFRQITKRRVIAPAIGNDRCYELGWIMGPEIGGFIGH